MKCIPVGIEIQYYWVKYQIGRQKKLLIGVRVSNDAGQKVKEVVEMYGLDISHFKTLDHKYAQHSRHAKAKLPGNEISVLSLPSVQALKLEETISGRRTVPLSNKTLW